MIGNSCQAKERADCIQTGNCEEYDNPYDEGIDQKVLKTDSLASDVDLDTDRLISQE